MATLVDLSRSARAVTRTGDASRMTRLQKLAFLLIILGPESAPQILETLEACELEAVSTEMARLPAITEETCAAILNGISEVPLAFSPAVPGERSLAQPGLEQALRDSNPADTLDRVSRQHGPLLPVQRRMELEARHLFHLLREERTPTIAQVVSLLRAETASELLNLLRPEVRAEIIELLAALDPTLVEKVRRLENDGETGTGREPGAA